MASIKNNGQEVIILCNMGYDYNGKKIKPVQKKVTVPDDVITTIWLSKQAEIFENEVKRRRTEPMPLVMFVLNHRDESKVKISNKDVERIAQWLGAVDIKDVTPKMLEEFHKQIAEETDLPFTAREHLHRALCELFRIATELGYITINPTFRTFRYEKKQKGNVKTVARSEIKKFIKCLDDEMPKHKLYYCLIIATGLTRAEVTALQWQDIDFKAKQVKGVPLPKSIMEQLNSCPKKEGAIFTHNGVEMAPSTFTYRTSLIRKKHNLQNITMHKIQNTVNQMLQTMDYKEMQRKVGL